MPLSPIAGAVIVHAGRLLLIRRTTPVGSLLWSLPSGKVEPGEPPAAAAAREALEEAGVTVKATALLGERVHPATGHLVSYWACTLLAGTAHPASPREVAEVAWVDRNRLAELVPGGLYAPVQAWVVGQLAE
ncbi:NUDIX domain-containing protein [Streptomyces sp. NPDC005483]|uniref:NUDIX hydrolase n=1 Tax=Streptomyces sp. NPDC005483 TaxID=3154882 RepID=UPI0033A1C6D0